MIVVEKQSWVYRFLGLYFLALERFIKIEITAAAAIT